MRRRTSSFFLSFPLSGAAVGALLIALASPAASAAQSAAPRGVRSGAQGGPRGAVSDAARDTGAARAPNSTPVVVFLVRHAEKSDGPGTDPPLSAAGHERARLLARMLRETGIGHVLTTDYARTRETAAPLGVAIGVEPELYDPRDLEGLARRLRAGPGRSLVVGHSNTTGALVRALGGDAHGSIAEDEYDRLYVVTIPARGSVSTVLLRYGAPSRR